MRVDESALLDRLLKMAIEMPERIEEIRKAVKADGLTNPLIDKLAVKLSERATQCRKLFETLGGEA